MSVEGTVLVKREGGRVDFSGWAADRSARAPADAIAVFLDGRLFYIASGAGIRRNQPAELDGIEGVGFGFALPESSLPEEGSDHVVRVFALTDSRVAELAYPPGLPLGYVVGTQRGDMASIQARKPRPAPRATRRRTASSRPRAARGSPPRSS